MLTRLTIAVQCMGLTLVLLLTGTARAETTISWDSGQIVESRMLRYRYGGGERHENPKDGSNYASRTLRRLDEPMMLLDRVLKRGAKLKGRIDEPPSGSVSGRVWLEDNYNRVLDRAEVLSPDFAFQLDASRSLNTGLYLKAELHTAEHIIWSKTQGLRMQPSDHDPWREFMLGVYNMGRKPGTGKLWRELGLSHRAVQTTASSIFTLQNDLKYHASNILYSLLGLYHRDHKHWREIKEEQAKRRGPVSLVRHRCLNDPKSEDFARIILTAAAQRFKPYPPLHYSIGDEIGIGNMAGPHDLCASKWCRPRFLDWLRERYGSLKDLNAHWETSYGDWQDVEMFSNWQAIDRAKTGNFAPWADRLEFMDEVLYGFIQKCVGMVRAVDKNARCNISGVQQPSCWGFDHWRLAQTVDCATPYEIGESPDVISSFYDDGKKGVIYAPGFGRDTSKVWLSFLRGYGISAQWDSFGKKTYSRLIDIEKQELTPLGQQVKTFADWVSAGPGRLRNRSVRSRDPVAILHSQPSLRANWILEIANRPDIMNGGEKWVHRDSWSVRKNEMSFRVRVSWVHWTHDIGIWPKFVDTREFDGGDLYKRGFRVLIVPRVAAMSDHTAESIRAFAKAGGTVIADTWCGIMDETCRLRKKGVLDDFFGVSRGDYRDIETDRLAPDKRGITWNGKSTSFLPLEKALMADGGKAGGNHQGADVMITRRFGKGRAVYLNFRLESYVFHRLLGKRLAPARQLLLDLLDQAGVRPRFAVTHPDAPSRFHTVGHDVCVYRNGRGYLVGVRPNPTVVFSELGGVESSYKNVKGNVFLESSPAVLRGPRGLWMYDMNEGLSLGAKESIAFTSKPGAGRLYAAWPFEIQGLKANVLVDKDRNLRITGEIQTSSPVRKEKLVISLRVFRPDGKEQPAYRWNIDCEKNAFRHSVPLGINESGEWMLELREPCSGVKAAATFEIK